MHDEMKNDDPRNGDALDLSALDLPAARRMALTAAILERAEPILARRRTARGPVLVLAAWLRPTLAAAALVMVASIAALLGNRPRDAGTVPTTAEALGFPAPVVAWTEAGRTPSLDELVVSMAANEQ